MLKTLECYPQFIPTFQRIGENFACSDDLLAEVEKFICALYKIKDCSKVNEARYELFKSGKFNEDSTPCTEDALTKHMQRVSYQCAIWKRALDRSISPPTINGHGWIVDGQSITVDWMDLPAAPDGVLDVVNCGCVTGCQTNRCSCFKAKLKCTDICGCQNCKNENIVEEESDSEELGTDSSESDTDLEY